MSLITKTFLIKGKNRKLLVERLKRAGVNILKIKIIDENRAKFTIDNKDSLKFFAICKNSWYNKELKIGGIFAPVYKMAKMGIVTVFVLLFFAIAYLGNSVYLESVYQGDALLYRSQTQKAFLSAGIKKYQPLTKQKLEKAKEILLNEYSIAFISLQKSGNKAIIYIKQSEQEPQKLPVLKSDLIAEETVKILKISVYSGTAVVKPGDTVNKGETIAKASYFIKEQQVECPLVCQVTVECAFKYVYECAFKPDSGKIANAVACAKLYLGDYMVRSHSVRILEENKIEITLNYEKILGGE